MDEDRHVELMRDGRRELHRGEQEASVAARRDDPPAGRRDGRPVGRTEREAERRRAPREDRSVRLVDRPDVAGPGIEAGGVVGQDRVARAAPPAPPGTRRGPPARRRTRRSCVPSRVASRSRRRPVGSAERSPGRSPSSSSKPVEREPGVADDPGRHRIRPPDRGRIDVDLDEVRQRQRPARGLDVVEPAADHETASASSSSARHSSRPGLQDVPAAQRVVGRDGAGAGDRRS